MLARSATRAHRLTALSLFHETRVACPSLSIRSSSYLTTNTLPQVPSSTATSNASFVKLSHASVTSTTRDVYSNDVLLTPATFETHPSFNLHMNPSPSSLALSSIPTRHTKLASTSTSSSLLSPSLMSAVTMLPHRAMSTTTPSSSSSSTSPSETPWWDPNHPLNKQAKEKAKEAKDTNDNSATTSKDNTINKVEGESNANTSITSNDAKVDTPTSTSSSSKPSVSKPVGGSAVEQAIYNIENNKINNNNTSEDEKKEDTNSKEKEGETDGKKKSIIQRIKDFIKEHGATGKLIYLFLFILFLIYLYHSFLSTFHPSSAVIKIYICPLM